MIIYPWKVPANTKYSLLSSFEGDEEKPFWYIKPPALLIIIKDDIAILVIDINILQSF